MFIVVRISHACITPGIIIYQIFVRVKLIMIINSRQLLVILIKIISDYIDAKRLIFFHKLIDSGGIFANHPE